jgi:hypothetical protein
MYTFLLIDVDRLNSDYKFSAINSQRLRKNANHICDLDACAEMFILTAMKDELQANN